MPYHELGTEKYYYASLAQELKEHRKQRNIDAVRAFKNFLCVLTVVAFTFVAIKMMPEWLPTVTAMLDQYGVTETLRSWRV